MRGLEKERSKRFPTLAALVNELTPPPVRSPRRFAAIAAAAVLLVGGAAAAVMVTRPDGAPPRVEGNDDKIIQNLQQRIVRLEQQRDELLRLITKKDSDLQEVPKLREKLQEKDEEIQDLAVKLAELRARQANSAPPPPQPIERKQINDAVQTVHRDVEGCLDEWAERAHLEQPKGSGVPLPSREAWISVQLRVTPDGVPHDAVAKGLDSPTVVMCVQDAMLRVRYPKGADVLYLKIDVAWAGGNLNMTGRVVGQREAPGSTLLDL
jgi:hypothetical protein